VLSRTEIRSKFPQITDVLVRQTIGDLGQAKRVSVETIEPVSRDPKDDIFLACAKVAQADYLVTEDNDLLVLGQRDNTRVINVMTFLPIVDQARTAQPHPPNSGES
jgi:predicted nucleic acid-binding protein